MGIGNLYSKSERIVTADRNPAISERGNPSINAIIIRQTPETWINALRKQNEKVSKAKPNLSMKGLANSVFSNGKEINLVTGKSYLFFITSTENQRAGRWEDWKRMVA